MQRLKNQPAIVTGANSGIGKAVAMHLAGEGAKVVVNYIADEKAAADVVAEIKQNGGEAIMFEADVSDEAQVQQMFKKTSEVFGTVHILVNNAGLQRDAKLTEMSLDDWNLVLKVNLTGQFLCSREAVKEFLNRGVDTSISAAAGKIICMSSVHEIIPWAGHANYAESKGGVMLLMKSMAQEYADDKIRINGVAPGAIKTKINEKAWSDPEAKNNLLNLIPSNRVGSPKDVAKAVVWLCSDESDYVNGTTLIVDGGMTLYPGFATGG
jgi:glucose 1-dehydrogenase